MIDPFDVLYFVITAIPVDMSNVLIFIRVLYKCFGHQSVHHDRCLFAGLLTKHHHFVRVAISSGFDRLFQ